jgi:hypothetical protein
VRREFKRHLFVVDSLDNKQMQNVNEKELIRLASAGVGRGLFLIFFGEY